MTDEKKTPSLPKSPFLRVKNLSFGYDPSSLILQDLNVELAAGERLAIMGPSGCGKSTLLRILGGFLKQTGGELENNFAQIAFVFQEPRLFPWMTVEENLKAVLPRSADPSLIREALELVELSDAAPLYPEELSGGMKSRVSLARALVYGGDLFLLDEPFSALDRELRLSLSQKLSQWLSARGAAAILVTHQEEDAHIFADRLLELSPVQS